MQSMAGAGVAALQTAVEVRDDEQRIVAAQSMMSTRGMRHSR